MITLYAENGGVSTDCPLTRKQLESLLDNNNIAIINDPDDDGPYEPAKFVAAVFCDDPISGTYYGFTKSEWDKEVDTAEEG